MDARIVYSKKCLKNAFFELLKEKPFNKITVTEICKLADINRATFYKYYDNPEDLLDKIENEYIEKLKDDIKKCVEEKKVPLYQFLFNDVKENFDFFKLVLVDNYDDNFRKKYLDACHDAEINEIKYYFPGISNMQCEWIFYFTTEGCIGIFKEWLNGEIDASLEQMITFTTDFVGRMNYHGKNL